MNDIKTLNFFLDDDLVADPYPYYEAMRGQCPVSREPHHGVMLVTGYEEATQVLQDSERFSSCISVTGPFPGFPVPLEGDDVSALIEQHRDELPMSDQLPTFDPPTHTDHRALLMRLITPKRLKENEEAIWRLADRLLDEFLTGGQGEFINGFASPFALLVIADLLGVPEEDQQGFIEGLRHRPRSEASVGAMGEAMAHSPMEFLYARFTAYIEDRRREPRDDVLSALAAARFPDGSVPEVIDVVRIAANLFSAGQETTVRLLSTALKVIAERPDLQELLRKERHRIPNLVEESLRIESPIKGDFRLTRVPTTVGGVDLPAGTMLMVMNGAANRDPRRFDDPAVFDIERSNVRQHIAFGRGVHTCPGAPLARTEARASIERLLDRTADIRISESAHGPEGARRYSYLPTYILRGLSELHLEFTLAEEEG
ncbi:cytochrome P450 [Catenulispora rubra]|uniref:cytochrome P450 n=1 Tax=Catenulispora rubra TaxID=280293 RepID=UPI00189227D0|nr:cytochrome P450 [Catenulispora rubra]